MLSVFAQYYQMKSRDDERNDNIFVENRSR